MKNLLLLLGSIPKYNFKYCFRIMKIYLFFLFLSTFQLLASNVTAQNKEIKLMSQSLSVGDLISEIEKQTDFLVVYTNQDIDIKRQVHTDKLIGSVSFFLKKAFDGTGVKYQFENGYIILNKHVTSQNAHSVQGKKIEGSVVDVHGEPIIGANIMVKGTTNGAISDLDGNFTLDIQEGSILVISYIGYQTLEVKLSSKSFYKITLKEDSKVLGEVVVTAMGIKRQAESLTYATQSINNTELTRAKGASFINSLQGKAAGLIITPNSSGAGGGSSKIILRGQSSILGNNQPLIVLDGIPLSNGMSAQKDDVITGAGRDGGDLLSTINPDDIANISLLKGPNAAALYGSAANNGVIVITTKGGSEGKPRISVSSNTLFETPLMYPEQQTVYGPEIIGSTVEYNAWGKPVSSLTDKELSQFPYLTRTPRNNITDFFRIGQTYNNSVSLSSGTEYSTTYFSYANTTQKGLIPNNDFMRHNLMLKESFSFFEKKLNVDMTLNYIIQKAENRPIVGKAKGVLPGLYRTPWAVDMRYFDINRSVIADKYNPISSGGPQTNPNLIGVPVQNFPWLNQTWINNPYFMLDAMNELSKKDRVMASLVVAYEIIKGLKIQGRASLDKVTANEKVQEDATLRMDKYQTLAGSYWSGKSYSKDFYADALLSYEKNIKEKISVSATIGASMKRRWNEDVSYYRDNDTTYVHPNWSRPIYGENSSLNIKKGSTIDVNDTGETMYWETAAFATAQMGFWNKGYIDVSFRNDWNKAFQQWARHTKRYKSFPYWSVGGNVLLKEIIDPYNKNELLNSLKVRASYSVVGNSIPDEFYDAQSISALTGVYSAKPAKFDDPKPETTKAIEVGVDGVFFNNRLGVDLTLYQSIMENQFLRITTSSGESKPVNSGRVRNQGVELSLNYNMNIARGLRWTTGLNLAYNDNEILDTYRAADGTDVEIQVGSSSLGIQSKYLKGGSYGDLYAKSFQMKDGKILLTGVDNSLTKLPGESDRDYERRKNQNASPQVTSTYDRFVGNTTAKFTYGWHNTFSWNDFVFYILLDGKIGGKVISITQSEMDQYGLSKRTAEARQQNGGWVILPDGQEVPARNYYETVGAEQYDCIYDATNLRVRELSLGYTFYDIFGYSKNLTISAVARNLGFLYKNAPVDPDMSVTAANGASGIESFSLPTTRSFGLNLKLNF